MSNSNISLRDKFVFLSRKIGILLFFAMFGYIALIKLFGEDIFPGRYVLVIFFSSVLFLILTFIPPQINREHWYAWFFFSSIIFLVLGMGLGAVLIYFFQIPRESFIVKICGSIIGLGIIGFFASFFIGNKKRSLKEIRQNITQSFRKVSENLGLNCKDESNDRVVKLTAEGNYKFGYIILYVENEFWRDPQGIRKTLTHESSILVETNHEIKLFKIEAYHKAVRIDGLDEPIKSKINDFIQKKNLNYLDFTINVISSSERLIDFFTKSVPKNYLSVSYKNFKWMVIINIHTAIEELGLWTDYIELAENLLSSG